MSVTLEVSKLSGWLNAHAPCRVSKGEGIRCTHDAGQGGRRAARKEDAARPRCKQREGRARLKIGGRARGSAHEEHPVHVCDAGGVEAQWLVQRVRALPRVEGTACDAGRGADRAAGGGGRPQCTQRAGEGPAADWESKKRRAMQGEVQTGRPEVAADRGARSVQGRARLQIGRRARGEERTRNM